jgi:signal transduction histidine kinase
MGRHRTRVVQADRARSFAALRGLSDEGLLYLQEVFERKRQGAGPTWAELLAELKDKFAFDWNDSSLSRYYGFWEAKLRVEQQAHQEAIGLAEHFLRNPTPEIQGMLSQLLEHQRLVALSNLDGADPADVVALGLAHDRVDLARRKLNLDQEKKQISEEKLVIDQARLELEREKKLAIDKPALFLEFFKSMTETLVQADPQAAEVLNKHFDRLLVKIKGASA